MSHKLGPELRSRLHDERSKAKAHQALSLKANATDEGVAEEAPERVEITLEFTGDLADLTDIGFEKHSFIEHPTEGYKIATGTLPANRIEALAEIEHLVQANLPRTLEPNLNFSGSETRADRVHRGSPSRRGAGVVIGVIDSGIDWRHGGFWDGEKSRVLAIWDQLLDPQPGETLGPRFGKDKTGVVYSQEQIARAVKGLETVRSLDLGTSKGDTKKDAGHGTHVAGIAAGDGAPASCCTPGSTFVGIAPDAELIVVRSDLIDIHVQVAINFILNYPAAAGKPIVINLSFGGHLGPHDGTTELERHIDAAVAGQTGRAIVVGAGNEGSLVPDREGYCPIHVESRVPGNTTSEVEFFVGDPHVGKKPAPHVDPSLVVGNCNLDLWYDRAGTLNLELVDAGGKPLGEVKHGGKGQSGNDLYPLLYANEDAGEDRRSTVSIEGLIDGPHGRNNNFRTTIYKPIQGNIPYGPWKLRLINPTATDVNFHCWSWPSTAGRFLPPDGLPDGKLRASSSSTVGMPGTAAGAITVANHASKTNWCDCWPSTGIFRTSSRGPVVRGAAANPKPDIAAPGLLITSAKSDAANLPGTCFSWCPDACCVLYEDRIGTSMSAPHVAGAIALMLEENPTLTKTQILQHLQDSARDRPPGGRDDAFGAGKLNVEAAIASVRGTGGGGGGGGGGGPLSPLDFGPSDAIGIATSRPDTLMVSADPGSRVKGPGNLPDPLVQFPPALRMLRACVESLPEGEQLAAAASRHFSEIRRLINTNRRVATMWHRSDGPRMLRGFLLGCEAPTTILTERHLVYLDCLCDQLAKYGSNRLSASIEQYRTTVLGLLKVPLAAQITVVTRGGHD